MRWAVIATIVLVGVAFAIWFRIQPSKASDWGAYWSAIAATIAFAWLIGGYFLQTRELQLQREQLALQREELALQREEMRRMVEQATLGQVATMLTNFNAGVPGHRLNSRTGQQTLATVQDLARFFASSTHAQIGREVREGANALSRWNHYKEWSAVVDLSREFLSTMRSAARLGASVSDVKLQDEAVDDAAWVMANEAALRSIQHVRLFAREARQIAEVLTSRYGEFLETRRAGLAATDEVNRTAMGPQT